MALWVTPFIILGGTALIVLLVWMVTPQPKIVPTLIGISIVLCTIGCTMLVVAKVFG